MEGREGPMESSDEESSAEQRRLTMSFRAMSANRAIGNHTSIMSI